MRPSRLTAPKSTKISKVAISDEYELEGAEPGYLIITLYGPPKVGKSTFASKFPNAYFISTQPGLKFLKVRKNDCTNWGEFKGIIQSLIDEDYKPAKIDTIIVDVVGELYRMCRDHCGDIHGFITPSDDGLGKWWDVINQE